MNTTVNWNYCGEPTEVVDGIPHYDYPIDSGMYLVTYRNGNVAVEWYDAEYLQWWEDNESIVAWADFPAPYKPFTRTR